MRLAAVGTKDWVMFSSRLIQRVLSPAHSVATSREAAVVTAPWP